MGLFDNITGFFTGQTAQNAADAQKAGLTAGYGQASDLLGQGRGALTTNYTAGLQPFMQNYGTATAGTGALTDALGITGDPSQVQARFANTPGYQFQLQQGNENVLRNASRTGQGNSGNVNLDLQKQGQGLANSTYQQYVQNLMPFLGASGAAASGIGGLSAGLGSGLAGSYGTQANAAYGTQAGIGNADASAELAKNSGVGNLLNLGMGIAGLGSGSIGGGAISGITKPAWNAATNSFMGPGSFTPSDARIKEGIESIGELFDGTGVYRYRYIGDDKPRIGLIAQEVEERNPDAVAEFDGVKMVDYGKATEFASKLAEFL